MQPILVHDPQPEPAPAPEKILEQQPEPELTQEVVETPQLPKQEKPKGKRGEVWERNLELYQKGVRGQSVYNWIADIRRQYKAGNLKEERHEKLTAINFPFDSTRKKTSDSEQEQMPQTPNMDVPKRKKSEAWERNYELYREGAKSTNIYNWIAENRRQYKTGTLKEERFEKLIAINFPFEVLKKKSKEIQEEAPKQVLMDSWYQNYELFRKGERNNAIFVWISKNRRLYKAGTLNDEHYKMLKQINFPFESQKKK
jgi:hypothetical protein